MSDIKQALILAKINADAQYDGTPMTVPPRIQDRLSEAPDPATSLYVAMAPFIMLMDASARKELDALLKQCKLDKPAKEEK